MVVVAVAGGTGDLGRTIAEELVRAGNHEVLVLGRKLSGTTASVPGCKSVFLDYDDVEAMALVLQSHRVHTIISALSVMGPGEKSQLNLIAAAEKSPTTQKFLPSEYGGNLDGAPPEAEAMSAPIFRGREALAKTSLETTYMSIGIFMDYFGHPNIPSTMRPFTWAIDFPSRRAAIPGTGNEVLTLTYSKDVARFIARLVDDSEWPRISHISGADTTLNEIVALGEKTIGEKFHVTYDSFEEIKEGKATPVVEGGVSYGGVSPTEMAVMMGMMMMGDGMVLPKADRLNDRYPDIPVMGIKEMIETAWSKK